MFSIPKGEKSAQSFECGFVERCPPQAVLWAVSSPRARAKAAVGGGRVSLHEGGHLGGVVGADAHIRPGSMWASTPTVRLLRLAGGTPLSVCPLGSLLPQGESKCSRWRWVGGCSEKIPHRGEFFQPGGSMTLPYGGAGCFHGAKAPGGSMTLPYKKKWKGRKSFDSLCSLRMTELLVCSLCQFAAESR